jgi:hypothetical protein
VRQLLHIGGFGGATVRGILDGLAHVARGEHGVQALGARLPEFHHVSLGWVS